MKPLSLSAETQLSSDWDSKDYHDEWRHAKSSWDKWAIIRQSYMDRTPRILAAGKRDGIGRIDPYWIPWPETFTDIEATTWNMIRAMGVTLYPQFPILNYFVDFGNPHLRVALEVDGQQWHQDKAKDRTRDEKIVKLGWHIYRCTGAEVKRCVPFPEEEQPQLAREYYLHTVDGVLSGIAHHYGIWNSGNYTYIDLLTETLERHRLVNFPIGR